MTLGTRGQNKDYVGSSPAPYGAISLKQPHPAIPS